VKLKIAAADVPLLVTDADDPAGPVVVGPTAIVAAAPDGPVLPVGPVGPVGPAGIPKLKTAADDVPLFVTVAGLPAVSVDVVPTAIVAADPAGPIGPGLPAGPGLPVGPAGMPKLKVAADDVPLLETVAGLPAVNVVVVPTAIVAAAPDGPVGPVGPGLPAGPGAPIAPVGPTGPGAPMLPVGPTGPVGPIEPVGPGAPVGPSWVYITCVAVRMMLGVTG
jgi:collagen type IV alpha